MIDFRGKETALAAVCLIEGKKIRYEGGGGASLCQGVGAFIAPDKVLTAWHVVNKMEGITFVNQDGKRAMKKSGAQHPRSIKKDLVIVTLDQPIGNHWLPTIKREESLLTGIEGIILSRRFNQPQRTQVRFNPLISNVEFRKFPYHIIFNAAAEITVGHSGSPILNRAGKIISVVSAGAAPEGHPNADKMIKKDDLMPYVAELGNGCPFVAVSPSEFAAFMEAAL
jgi:S1-C subfamily serine protease